MKGEVEDMGNYSNTHGRRVNWDLMGIKKKKKMNGSTESCGWSKTRVEFYKRTEALCRTKKQPSINCT